MWTQELFKVEKPIIALLHLRAMPGDPLYGDQGADVSAVEGRYIRIRDGISTVVG